MHASTRTFLILVCLAGCPQSSERPTPQPVDAAIIDTPAIEAENEAPPDVIIGHDGQPPSPDARDVRVALCRLDPPTSCPEPPVRYADVAPIVERRCLGCHNGRGPHWPLTSYQHVTDWQDTIRAAMLDCSMPPAESGLTMPLEERMALLHWVRCGVLP